MGKKRKLTNAALASIAMFGASCATSPSFNLEPATAPMPEKWAQSVESVPYLPSLDTPSPSSVEMVDPEPTATPPMPTTPAIVSTPRDLPYGVPVPGKTGLVRSPWSDQGFVDVGGMPPGIEAKCPYSGKVFLVP
jgi:hypothetical protein